MVNNKISVKSSWSERHFNTHQGVGGGPAKLYRSKHDDKGRKQSIYFVKEKSIQLQIRPANPAHYQTASICSSKEYMDR